MNDRAALVALDLIARKVDSLPLAYLQAREQYVQTHPTQTATPDAGSMSTVSASDMNRANRAAIDNWPRLISSLNSILAALNDKHKKGGGGGTGGKQAEPKAPTYGPISPDEMRAAIFAASPLVKASLGSNFKTTDPTQQRQELIASDKQGMVFTPNSVKHMTDAMVAAFHAALPVQAPNLSAKGLTAMSTGDVAALHAQLPKPPAPPPEVHELPPPEWTRRKGPRKPQGWAARARSGFKRLGSMFSPTSGVRQRKAAVAAAGKKQQAAAAKAARSPFRQGVDKLTAPLMGALSKIGGPILLALAPLGILAAVVTSTASGFSAVLTTAKLLAATLAPLLLPIFFVLAVGLADLSDMLWGKVLPALEGWYTLIIGPGLDAMKAFIDGLKDVIEVLSAVNAVKSGNAPDSTGNGQSTLEAVGGGLDLAMTPFKPMNALLTKLTGEEAPTFKGVAKDIMGSDAGGATETKAQVAARLRGETQAEMSKGNTATDNKLAVMKELQMSMLGKGSIGNVAGINRSMQQAAFGMSPFEAKMLERMQQEINILAQVANNTSKTTGGRYGS